MDKKTIGSLTAKGGFANERNICEKFLNWKSDKDSQDWLKQMGYKIENIRHLKAEVIPTSISIKQASYFGISKEKFHDSIKYKKADLQINVVIEIDSVIYTENISLKKANINSDYNQVDKRRVKTYQELWGFDDNISKWLKLFTGEYLPKDYKNQINYEKLKKSNRIFFNEIPDIELKKIIEFFTKNKILIICDILKGRGGFSSEWILVTETHPETACNCHPKWILRDINYAINHYSQGDVILAPRGSLNIGKITMQRKGGTPDPNSLQFKIHPLELFDNSL